MAIDVGIVDRFPGESVRAGRIDRGFGLNVILSGRLEPEGVTGWDDTRMGVLRAGRHVEQRDQAQLPRRALDAPLSVIRARNRPRSSVSGSGCRR
jgi:hypothetical protein